MAILPENGARALQLTKELNEINGAAVTTTTEPPRLLNEFEIETNILTDLLSSLALSSAFPPSDGWERKGRHSFPAWLAIRYRPF